jgi:hypothetical protein
MATIAGRFFERSAGLITQRGGDLGGAAWRIPAMRVRLNS